MKLRIRLEIYCSLCKNPFSGQAIIWSESGWDTKTFLERATPLDEKDGIITNDGGGNRFTCKSCLDAIASNRDNREDKP